MLNIANNKINKNNKNNKININNLTNQISQTQIVFGLLKKSNPNITIFKENVIKNILNKFLPGNDERFSSKQYNKNSNEMKLYLTDYIGIYNIGTGHLIKFSYSY